MKTFRFLLMVLLWVGTSEGLTQQVVRIRRPYILIQIDDRTDIKVGDERFLYRTSSTGELQPVAKVEFILIRDNQYAAKIISENRSSPVELGDVLSEGLPKQQETAIRSRPKTKPRVRVGPRRSQWLSFVTIGAGLVSGGLGYHFYNEAEYASKIQPVSFEHQATLAADIRRYDNQSNFCIGLGGGLIAFGIAHYFLTRNKPPRQDISLDLHPVQKKGYFGLGLQIGLNP